MHGSEVILIILVYFIIVVTVLTLLWRITIALDKIGEKLSEISKTLASRSEEKK
jgi:hypothetical protein